MQLSLLPLLPLHLTLSLLLSIRPLLALPIPTVKHPTSSLRGSIFYSHTADGHPITEISHGTYQPSDPSQPPTHHSTRLISHRDFGSPVEKSKTPLFSGGRTHTEVRVPAAKTGSLMARLGVPVAWQGRAGRQSKYVANGHMTKYRMDGNAHESVSPRHVVEGGNHHVHQIFVGPKGSGWRPNGRP